MDSKKTILLQCSLGSVFSEFSDKVLREISFGSQRKLAISGRVNSPGIVDVPEGATLGDIITLAGGIINNWKFKAAQIGISFEGFLTKEALDKPFDFNMFNDGIYHSIIILSQDDCIVQYAKFYLGFLICRINSGGFEKYAAAEKEILYMWEVMDRISKGRSNMRDIYDLREYSHIVKEKTEQRYSIIEEIIDCFYGELEEHIEDNRCYTSQCNHLTKLTITEKCIGCGRCKTVCPVDCIHGEIRKQHVIDYNRCTHCGACVSICPVSAITSGNNTVLFLRDLGTLGKVIITQMAPSVRVTIGEAFGFEPGENVEKKIAAALRRLGVDYVFDTTWAADLLIMEEAVELQDRVERYMAGDKDVKLPILTSCCPAWVKFIEQNYGDMLDVPSSAKSPMEMFAAVAKDIWAKEKGIDREKMACVAIMPCIAKKFEASRPEFSRGLNYDVDYVITTSELIDIFKASGIDLRELEDEGIDRVMGEYTGGGIIFGRTGGVIEAAARVAVERITGKRVENVEFKSLRGWEGFRSCELEVDGLKLRIGVAHGLKDAGRMLDKIRSGEEFFHAIEIMACPGGCVGGGGQPKIRVNREEVIKKRMEGLNRIDSSKVLRRSNENPEVLALYDKYLGYPLSNRANELLHTRYFIRKKK